MSEEFVDDGLEVSQRSDRRQGWQVRRSDQSAQRAQQQGRFDDAQRDAAIMQTAGLPVILKAGRRRRLRQFDVRVTTPAT